VAETETPKTPAKRAAPAGKGITAKFGPLPIWAWGAIALVVFIAVYYYYSKASGSSNTAANATGTSTDTSGTSGIQSVTPTSSGYDVSLTGDQLASMLSGSSQTGGNPTMSDYLNDLEGLQGATNTAAQALNDSYVAGIAQGAGQQLPTTNTGQSTASPAKQAAKLTTAVTAAKTRGVVLPKGYNASLVNSNLLSVVKLKTGAFSYSYKGGRKVTQAPGKSPYVVAPGSGR
jgi:hypothetical protein